MNLSTEHRAMALLGQRKVVRNAFFAAARWIANRGSSVPRNVTEALPRVGTSPAGSVPPEQLHLESSKPYLTSWRPD